MKLNNHLLYIDITQICGVGCDFCMYADKHGKMNMALHDKSKMNLSNLINANGVKKVSISGEGEPLNNIKTFYEILQLSKGGVSFEFITSGYIHHEKLLSLYTEINEAITNSGDTCNIRLSADSHHIAKLKNKPHGVSAKYFLDHNLQNMTLSFRSTDTDKDFSRNYLVDELNRYGLDSRIEAVSLLEDMLKVDDKCFNVDYKNIVWPSSSSKNHLDLRGYIEALEQKYGKRFTLGSLNKKASPNGLDITIKPNGDVFFYGIECVALGNIHRDDIGIDYLLQKVSDDPLINALYSTPFIDLLNKISIYDHVEEIVKKVNNPYWLIKELHQHDTRLMDGIV
jgi:hypothetical protein